MAALTIDLDDQASAGLDAINAALDQSADAALVAAKGADVLTQAQNRQMVVIQKGEAGYVALGKAGIQVFGQLGVAGIGAFRDIEVATIKSISAMEQTLVKSGASIIK